MIPWKNPNDELPSPSSDSSFTSHPLLFVADGMVYSGYFHENGCFYNFDYRRRNKSLFGARASKLGLTTNSPFMETQTAWPECTAWVYLSDVPIELNQKSP